MSNGTALSTGTRIGPYEIVGLLGAGGMGEVYRARDTKLNREVAIKVLLAAVANDDERLARFSREAQLIASINHPNIAQIHGLEDAGSSRALVMELVEGPTLADRIAREPIPIEEALPIARQIAEALEAAHDLGIIHRDLKPANIKIRADGTVKVLDFGLAKALDPAGAMSGDAANSPTLSMQATAAGVILGTAAYMAPEQARGKSVDRRADIWAFGCVLFEMLSGQRAFQADDVTDTIVALLTKEPDWNLLSPSSSKVRPLLSRCLDKDRKQRLQAIGEARYQIGQLLNDTSPEIASARSAAATPWRAIVAVAAIAAAVAAVATWTMTRPAPTAPPQLSRFEIVPTLAHALAPGSDRDIAISPNGHYIVYRGGERGAQLILRPIDSLAARVIPGGANARVPIFSTDSQWIAFFDGIILKKVSISGGAAINIARSLTQSRGASWGADDRIVFAINDPGKGLYSVPASGGEPAVLTTLDSAQGEINHWYPAVLPGRRGVLFTVTARDAAATARVAVLDNRTGKHKILTRGSQAEYVPGGLLYVTDGTLHAVRFDLEKLELIGNPFPVVEGVSTRGGGAANYGVSLTGTLVFMPTEIEQPRTIVWVDRQGKETAIPVPPRIYDEPRLSPDEKQIAVSVRDPGSEIYVVSLDQASSPRKLTFEGGSNAAPTWTPDGKRIIFRSGRGGQTNLYVQRADGAGAAERLTTGRYWQSPSSVTRDGRSVLGYTNSPEVSGDVVRFSLGQLSQPAASDSALSPPEILVQTRFFESNPVISPDGRYIAYQSNEAGRNEIYVRPYPKIDGGRWLVSSDGGTSPVWAQTGTELFYLDFENRLMAVPLKISEASFNAGTPVRQFDTAYAQARDSWAARGYDVSKDSRRFLMVRELAVSENSQQRLVVILNWFEELKAKLAAK